MKIAVVDGQGGGLGKSIIEKIRKSFGGDIEIIALGTNSLATAGMIKAGADKGATGENAIIVNCKKVDLIIGPMAIIISDSLLGEITKEVASVIASSGATKLLLPLDKCGIIVLGAKDFNINLLLEDMIERITSLLKV